MFDTLDYSLVNHHHQLHLSHIFQLVLYIKYFLYTYKDLLNIRPSELDDAIHPGYGLREEF